MEDYRIVGGLKLGSNLKDKEWMIGFQNLKSRLDWSLIYYRNTQEVGFVFSDAAGNPIAAYPGKSFTNLYQAGISYPFTINKSILY